MRNVLGRTMIAAGVLIGVAACSDGTGPQQAQDPLLDELVDQEILSVVADGVSQDLDLIRAFGPGMIGGPLMHPGGPTDGSPGSCTFDGTSHVCSRGTMDALEMSRSVTFFDAAGDPMESYHPELTDSIRFVFDLEGSREGFRDETSILATIDRHQEKTVSGLLNTETTREWNGEGTDETYREITNPLGEQFTFKLEATTQAEQVIMPVPDGTDEMRWPLSGTISKQVTVAVTRFNGDTVNRERNVVIEFNGTNIVTILINGEPTEVDLAQRRDQDRFRRHHG
jgi:hypothetical protein